MPHLILDNVTVDFPIYDGGHRSLRRTVALGVGGTILRRNNRHLVVRALTDVSLDCHEGDRIGLVGHNGAGKSTLLRVLAGLFQPTRGRVSIQGRLSPLFNPSALLDPEMTGDENIDHAAVLLEIPSRRRASLKEEVAEFTELGDFLRLPVKTYSAGMQLRLAFALMTEQEPEIVLFDEVLGVGDAQFMVKAAARLEAFRARTSIVVMASHNNGQVRSMCNKVAWLEHGQLRMFGPAEEVLAAYEASCPAGKKTADVAS